MRRSLPYSTLLLLVPAAGCVLPGADDPQGDTSGADDADDDGTGSGPSTADGGQDASTAAQDDESDGGADEESSGGDDDGSTGGAPITTCTAATLRLGNPYYEGDSSGWNPAGQGVLEDPPVPSRQMAVSDGLLYFETQKEVWVADDTTVRRVAGNEDQTTEYVASGACDDLRFLITSGVAALPNGNLVVGDFRGNGLVELSDPAGECTAVTIAGNPGPTSQSEIDDVADPGDVDGPGASARFYGPLRPTADDEGNVYVIDLGNSKIKQIAADSDRTVTTMATFEGATPLAMTAMNGLLYVVGVTGIDEFIWAIDSANPGEADVVYEGTGLFEEVGDNTSAIMLAATNDGVDLLVATYKGWIFRVSTDGQSLGPVAGIGQVIGFPTDLDLSKPIPVDQLPLRPLSSNEGSLVRHGDDLLFAGNANGPSYHVWNIDCE